MQENNTQFQVDIAIMLETTGKSRTAGQPPVQQSPVYLGIRGAILGHSVTPGTKLPEDELGAVSQAVNRNTAESTAKDLISRFITVTPNPKVQKYTDTQGKLAAPCSLTAMH